MMIFKIVVKNAENVIEDHFWSFIEENELCTVQASCEYSEKYNGFELEMVPQNDEDHFEFMQLCNNLIEHLEGLGYEF